MGENEIVLWFDLTPQKSPCRKGNEQLGLWLWSHNSLMRHTSGDVVVRVLGVLDGQPVPGQPLAAVDLHVVAARPELLLRDVAAAPAHGQGHVVVVQQEAVPENGDRSMRPGRPGRASGTPGACHSEFTAVHGKALLRHTVAKENLFLCASR